MPIDLRLETAKYYDLQPMRFDDVPFYITHLPSPEAWVLELGCGTGRVLVPLAAHCRSILGIDASEAMLDVCREKLRAAGIAPEKASVEPGDITDLDLGETFDYIIAPFRVMQNLPTDAEIEGLFGVIRRHLAPTGTCILNVFRPLLERERMPAEWPRAGETPDFEVSVENGRLVRTHTRHRLQTDPLVVFAELIYRRYEGDQLVEEAVQPIPMRCWYPDEFLTLIASHGFLVTGCWGGYAGEVYGEGPELIVAFKKEE